jgi:hypothetical protein
MYRSRIHLRSLLLRVSCVAFGFGLMTLPAKAETAASTYADVLNALQSGKAVTVLNDLSQCTDVENGKSGPRVQGGLQIRAFMVLPERGLVFSDVHQTLDRSDQPVTEYIRYNLKTDGEMTLAVTRQTSTGMVKQSPLTCHIAAGVRFVW